VHVITTNNISIGQQAGFGMSAYGRTRALPITDTNVALAAGQKCALMGTTTLTRIAGMGDVAVKGVFPGPSAWSPPI
jgi:hypothetical protein